ncbi:MAG: hypothetical protein M3P85_16080 [Actinomycetota bacterium]|nr:hypothetical protein [Actinomycetota bacterium]
MTGSVERHAQTEGRPTNAGIGFFTGYERMLVTLAGDELPMRDTARTFWLTNRHVHGNQLLTYTADRGEKFFNQQVCELDDALRAANEILRTVTHGGALTVNDAERLVELPTLVRRYKMAYGEFRRRDADGLRITPEFFTFVFRTFLPAIEIDGETWQGPNAAWLASVFSFDSLFGTATTWYRHYNLDKTKYLTANETATVAADLARPSVIDTLAATIRLPAGLASVPRSELAARLERSGRHVVNAARAVRDTWLEVVRGTKGHETLVRDFLDKPSAKLDEAEVARMAVKPGEGTGGGTSDLLADIGDMRKSCVPARALLEALWLIDNEPGTGAVAA